MITGQGLVSLLILALFILGMFLVGMYFARLERKRSQNWEVVAEGEFDHAELGYDEYSKRSGAMVHTTTHYRVRRNTIHFSDGSSCVAFGRHDLSCPKGTLLRVWRNGVDQYRIEKA